MRKHTGIFLALALCVTLAGEGISQETREERRPQAGRENVDRGADREGRDWEGRRGREGERGRPDMDIQPGRFMARFMDLHRRVESIRDQEDQIEDMTRKLEETRASIPAEQQEKIERLIDLKKQVNELEKEVFTDQVRHETSRMIGAIDERIERAEEAGLEEPVRMMLAIKGRLEKIQAASGDFDALDELLKESDPRRLWDNNLSEREKRLAREVEVLRERLIRLEMELTDRPEGDWQEFLPPPPPHPEMLPPPHAEDNSLKPGTQAPNPEAMRRGNAGPYDDSEEPRRRRSRDTE